MARFLAGQLYGTASDRLTGQVTRKQPWHRVGSFPVAAIRQTRTTPVLSKLDSTPDRRVVADYRL